MKIIIYKNREQILFKVNDNEDMNLNFENIKKLSKEFLEKKKNGESTEFNIDAGSDMTLYKNTLENILNSILEDEQLFELYKEKTIG